jgi:hypothetical protein
LAASLNTKLHCENWSSPYTNDGINPALDDCQHSTEIYIFQTPQSGTHSALPPLYEIPVTISTTLIKSIQDIMRQDAGIDGDAQRISQLSWLFFLKIFDDQ